MDQRTDRSRPTAELFGDRFFAVAAIEPKHDGGPLSERQLQQLLGQFIDVVNAIEGAAVYAGPSRDALLEAALIITLRPATAGVVDR